MANCPNFGKRYEDDNSFFFNPIPFEFVELHQVGELYCEAGYEIEQHRQQVFEITYIITGKGTVITDGQAVPAEENDVFINTVGQTHAIRADRGTPLRFCYLGFTFLRNMGSDSETERFYRSWSRAQPLRCKGLLLPFSCIFDEFRRKKEFHQLMVGAYVEQIIAEIHREYTEQHIGGAAAGDSRTGSAAYTLVRYIDRHYRDIDDIRELAAQLGYSYTYLAHTFKDTMSMTIGSYIIMKKMEEAKWLLRSGRMNVSQIAARFNYQSVQSFSNSFKKAVGISPTDYQSLSAEEAEAYNAYAP